MDQGLHSRTYLSRPPHGRAWVSFIVSLLGLAAVAWAIADSTEPTQLMDLRSLLIVGVGTLATTLLQFDLRTLLLTLGAVLRSFFTSSDTSVIEMLKEVDQAIMQNAHLVTLRDGSTVNGELLNDVIYMHHQGLLFDEIDQFVTAHVEDRYHRRRISSELLRRAALTAPALGLFGTVLGLVGVLRSMENPADIGPQMSLALMTTAYGAGLGSLVFTPLAGRLEYMNATYLETHRQLLSRIGILLSREERAFQVPHAPRSSEIAEDA